MQITILAFGAIRELTGKSEFNLDGISTTDDLVKYLELQFPALRDLGYAIAVNKKMMSSSMALEDHATVALLPPFSGG